MPSPSLAKAKERDVPRPILQRNAPLLRKAQTDPEAFGEFYDAFSRRLLSYFARRVLDSNAAFDLTSETFAKALAASEQFRGRTREEEEGWLFAIARSELSDYWRRGQVERTAMARIGIDPCELTTAEVERVEELADLRAVRDRLAEALDALPEQQRQAVTLRIVDELDYRAVAAVLEITEDNARARVSRGLRALGRELARSDTILERSA